MDRVMLLRGSRGIICQHDGAYAGKDWPGSSSGVSSKPPTAALGLKRWAPPGPERASDALERRRPVTA